MFLAASGCRDAGPRYTQVFTGFNGPSRPQTTYFMDPASAKNSWLNRALGPTELDRVLSQVSFENQMLAVGAVGKREGATGVKIDHISQREAALTVILLIGVNDDGCGESRSASFPFVLAIVDRPAKFDRTESSFHQNYPDGCKPPKADTPNELPPSPRANAISTLTSAAPSSPHTASISSSGSQPERP